jgi:predicted deacylase
MQETLDVGGQRCAPGTKQVVALPVTTDLSGGKIKLYVHVVNGREPGPTLTLLSTLHGSEFWSIETVRRLVEGLDPSRLRGAVLAVPVGNPVALQMSTRATPDESDAPDLNRVFPGYNTWITEQLASVMTEAVLKKADYVIDFHIGPWGCCMGTVMYGTDFDEDVVEKSRDMAFAFGYPCIQTGKIASGFPGPRSSCGYAGKVLKIPNLIIEIGGAGFDKAHEEAWYRINLDGLRNIMIHAGMLEGELDLPDRYLTWAKRWRVNPSVGGLLFPEIPPNDLMRQVRQGEVLGKVVSPYTFEVLEELAAPGDGVVFYTARDYPVRPGDWAWGVIDLNDAGTSWVDNPLRRK